MSINPFPYGCEKVLQCIAPYDIANNEIYDIPRGYGGPHTRSPLPHDSFILFPDEYTKGVTINPRLGISENRYVRNVKLVNDSTSKEELKENLSETERYQWFIIDPNGDKIVAGLYNPWDDRYEMGECGFAPSTEHAESVFLYQNTWLNAMYTAVMDEYRGEYNRRLKLNDYGLFFGLLDSARIFDLHPITPQKPADLDFSNVIPKQISWDQERDYENNIKAATRMTECAEAYGMDIMEMFERATKTITISSSNGLTPNDERKVTMTVIQTPPTSDITNPKTGKRLDEIVMSPQTAFFPFKMAAISVRGGQLLSASIKDQSKNYGKEIPLTRYPTTNMLLHPNKAISTPIKKSFTHIHVQSSIFTHIRDQKGDALNGGWDDESARFTRQSFQYMKKIQMRRELLEAQNDPDNDIVLDDPKWNLIKEPTEFEQEYFKSMKGPNGSISNGIDDPRGYSGGYNHVTNCLWGLNEYLPNPFELREFPSLDSITFKDSHPKAPTLDLSNFLNLNEEKSQMDVESDEIDLGLQEEDGIGIDQDFWIHPNLRPHFLQTGYVESLQAVSLVQCLSILSASNVPNPVKQGILSYLRPSDFNAGIMSKYMKSIEYNFSWMSKQCRQFGISLHYLTLLKQEEHWREGLWTRKEILEKTPVNFTIDTNAFNDSHTVTLSDARMLHDGLNLCIDAHDVFISLLTYRDIYFENLSDNDFTPATIHEMETGVWNLSFQIRIHIVDKNDIKEHEYDRDDTMFTGRAITVIYETPLFQHAITIDFESERSKMYYDKRLSASCLYGVGTAHCTQWHVARSPSSASRPTPYQPNLSGYVNRITIVPSNENEMTDKTDLSIWRDQFIEPFDPSLSKIGQESLPIFPTPTFAEVRQQQQISTVLEQVPHDPNMVQRIIMRNNTRLDTEKQMAMRSEQTFWTEMQHERGNKTKLSKSNELESNISIDSEKENWITKSTEIRHCRKVEYAKEYGTPSFVKKLSVTKGEYDFDECVRQQDLRKEQISRKIRPKRKPRSGRTLKAMRSKPSSLTSEDDDERKREDLVLTDPELTARVLFMMFSENLIYPDLTETRWVSPDYKYNPIADRMIDCCIPATPQEYNNNMRCPGIDLDMCLVPRGVYDAISFAQDTRSTISNIHEYEDKYERVNEVLDRDFHSKKALPQHSREKPGTKSYRIPAMPLSDTDKIFYPRGNTPPIFIPRVYDQRDTADPVKGTTEETDEKKENNDQEPMDVTMQEEKKDTEEERDINKLSSIDKAPHNEEKNEILESTTTTNTMINMPKGSIFVPNNTTEMEMESGTEEEEEDFVDIEENEDEKENIEEETGDIDMGGNENDIANFVENEDDESDHDELEAEYYIDQDGDRTLDLD